LLKQTLLDSKKVRFTQTYDALPTGEVTTPAQFLTTVLSPVGGLEDMDNWEMGQLQIKQHPPSSVALVLAAQPYPSLLDLISPVPFSTTVPSLVGDRLSKADWAMEQIRTLALHHLL
jgi:hypothetical protein